MSSIRNFLAASAVALTVSLPVHAQDFHAVADSLELAGIPVSNDERRQILAEFSGANPHPWLEISLPLLDDMAELSLEAERPAARVRLQDMHRQLIATLVPGNNLARDLIDKTDRMVNQVETGVGMTERDLGWSIMLEGLKANLPDDPRQLQLADADANRLVTEVNARFADSSNGAKQFLARVDAWGAGTVAAWPVMSAEERKIAASVITEAAIPPEAVLQKVIGATDILHWLAGMDIGLTDAEKATYPELAEYLEAGYMAGGIDGLLAQRVRQSRGGGAIGGGGDFLWNYNMMLLFDN